jgi:hypothetical protein
MKPTLRSPHPFGNVFISRIAAQPSTIPELVSTLNSFSLDNRTLRVNAENPINNTITLEKTQFVDHITLKHRIARRKDNHYAQATSHKNWSISPYTREDCAAPNRTKIYNKAPARARYVKIETSESAELKSEQ